MKGNNTKPPSGTRDFLPQDVKSRDRVFSTIKEVFENYGFLPMDTPSFERIETLNEKYGEDGDKLMFKNPRGFLPLSPSYSVCSGYKSSSSGNSNTLSGYQLSSSGI